MSQQPILSTATTTSSGTATSTVVVTETKPESKILFLKLKNKPPRIQWSEDTIDNENLQRKSSKRCCIYHKPKKFGESDSDETDSDGEGVKEVDRKASNRPKSFQRFHA